MSAHVPVEQVRAFIETVRDGIGAEARHAAAHDIHICDELLDVWNAAHKLERQISEDPEAAA